MRNILAVIAVAAAAACAPMHGGSSEEQWVTVRVDVVPVEASMEQVGRLAWRGGVELRTRSPMFVSLSGIEVLDDGRLVGISDEADWVTGDLMLDDRGYLTGFANARAALMRDEHGDAFTTKSEGDSEGLAQLPDGRFAVSFERTNLIRIYDFNRDGPFGQAARGPRLDEVDDLPGNSGLEALAAMDNALFAGAEGGDHRTTPVWLLPLEAREPVGPRFRYPLSDGFSLTGMDRLPDGSFVALERFYAPVIGPRARITRFTLPSGDRRRIEPEQLALLEAPFPVDNFEGISAVRLPNGATRIYIVSDNNNSAQQRTLLLAFDLIEDGASN
jgi:hypothetical protein